MSDWAAYLDGVPRYPARHGRRATPLTRRDDGAVVAMEADLNSWLHHYNIERPHLGYRNQGRRPIENRSGQVSMVQVPVPSSSLSCGFPGHPKDSNVSTSLPSGKNNFPNTPSLYPKFSDFELLKQ